MGEHPLEERTPAHALESWFEPARFYAAGYPEGITSALRLLPRLALMIEQFIAGIDPKRALEIGPGDRPTIASVRGAVYLDLVPGFLSRAGGRGVRGDVREAPFKPGSFDLVVANDVLTHIPPEDRARALAEIMALAPRVLVFIPRGGARELESTLVSADAVVEALEDDGFKVERHSYGAPAQDGTHDMELLYGAKRK